MKFNQTASRGHLVVGVVLILLSLIALLFDMRANNSLTAFAVFFFGVWGGVELGRYLEYRLNNYPISNTG